MKAEDLHKYTMTVVGICADFKSRTDTEENLRGRLFEAAKAFIIIQSPWYKKFYWKCLKAKNHE